MLIKIYVFLILVMVGLSSASIAIAGDCKADGYTVIFVNGIFTNESNARSDSNDLRDRYSESGKYDNIIFRSGYNPPHIAGFGDVVQSVSQALGSSMSDFDLKTILMQIHSEVLRYQ